MTVTTLNLPLLGIAAQTAELNLLEEIIDGVYSTDFDKLFVTKTVKVCWGPGLDSLAWLRSLSMGSRSRLLQFTLPHVWLRVHTGNVMGLRRPTARSCEEFCAKIDRRLFYWYSRQRQHSRLGASATGAKCDPDGHSRRVHQASIRGMEWNELIAMLRDRPLRWISGL